MVFFFVVNMMVGSSKIRILELFIMLVWFGKIIFYYKIFFVENIKYMKCYIFMWVIFEWIISYRKISVFRIESVKIIVMFSCENYVFNICILYYFCLLFWIKIYRI